MVMLARLGAVALVIALGGCATAAQNPADPLEPFNRATFAFNENVDKAVLKPVAQGYRAVGPQLARTGVPNFFANLEDLWISANNLMQGKIEFAVDDLLRFTFNSTFGLLGVIDIASDMGLDKHNEDFGQTLGRWGIASGAYLVLPLLGPSTVRDGAARVVDWQGDVVGNLGHVPTRNALYGTRVVSDRSNLFDAAGIVEEAALDKYTFVRDSWL